jgi:hypothetical protein
MRCRRLVFSLLALTIALPVAILSGQMSDRPDLDAIYKIKEEGFQRSQIMEIMSYLTDVHGPRLTNSPNIKAAANWTTGKMTEWGLTNVKLEPWGPFGRGWSNEKFYLQATAPQKYPIFGYPKAWSPGTNGLVSGEAVMVTIATEKDVESYRGKLRGKFVMAAPLADVAPSFAPLARRYDEQDLENLSKQPSPAPGGGGRGGRGGFPAAGGANPQDLNRMRNELFLSEGILGTLEPSRGVNGGTIFVQGAQGGGG